MVPDTRFGLSLMTLGATIFAPLVAILVCVWSGDKLQNLHYDGIFWAVMIGLIITYFARKLDVAVYKDVEADATWRKRVRDMTEDELHDYFKRRNLSITQCMRKGLERLPSGMRDEIPDSQSKTG